MSASTAGSSLVSVVVPVTERYGDLAALFGEFSRELTRLGRPFEFLFVVDGDRQDCLPALRELRRQSGGAVSVLVFGRSFGEAAALHVGMERAKGGTILTLPSYFQVGPEGVEAALRAVEQEGVDLAVGCRHPRADALWNRAQARVFHWLVATMTATHFSDVSCGFRALHRDTARELSLYGDLHRFIPILAEHRGFAVREIPLAQRSEDRSARYVGAGVVVRRLLDLLTVFFLIKFTRKPLRFFGLIGSTVFGAGFATTLYLALYRIFGYGGISDRPLLLLGVLLMVLGVQSISIGLLGEIIIFTHARRMGAQRVVEIP